MVLHIRVIMCCGHSAETGCTPIPNLLRMLKLIIACVRAHRHTSRGMQFYFSYNEAFWREQDRPPKMVQKWLERTCKGASVGAFMVVREWG